MLFTFVTRATDIIISLIGILAFFPLWALIAIIIKLDSPGPIFVEFQTRIGHKFKDFHLYKFRTMHVGAHKKIRKDAELFKKLQNGGGKLREDPRVTRFGRLLRKIDLDEAPQFINVLKGEMSIVGFRPLFRDEYEDYLKRFPQTEDVAKFAYDNSKPGLTGTWQISGRNDILFPGRIKMDATYAKHRSLDEYFGIILRTPIYLITRKGSWTR